jgi:hypothetical protein
LTRPAIQLISPLPPEQIVIVLLTIEDIVPQTAIEQVSSRASPECITALISKELIVPQAPVQCVIVVSTEIRDSEDGDTVCGEVAWGICFPFLIPVYGIVAIATEEFVTPAASGYRIIAPQRANFISPAGR